MTTVLLTIMGVSVVLLLIYLAEIKVLEDKVLVYNTNIKAIEEDLSNIRDPLIFKYLLNRYLKNHYRVGIEKKYHKVLYYAYHIYYKVYERGYLTPKWKIYTEARYSWDQANILLDKIRKEKYQNITERRKEVRKEVLKTEFPKYFEEDDKILYK